MSECTKSGTVDPFLNLGKANQYLIITYARTMFYWPNLYLLHSLIEALNCDSCKYRRYPDCPWKVSEKCCGGSATRWVMAMAAFFFVDAYYIHTPFVLSRRTPHPLLSGVFTHLPEVRLLGLTPLHTSLEYTEGCQAKQKQTMLHPATAQRNAASTFGMSYTRASE